MEKLYARDIYGKTLVELGKKDPRIVVLDADLSSSTRTSFFAKEFPERFFNFGVAEQNMLAASAGLASCGKIVFASTFAMFASARALDQIRNSICYNNFNVKIVATHGGITVGEDGASHQALEDVAFLRPIPNMRIVIPADPYETRDAVISAYETEGPFYIRLGRAKVPMLENRKPFQLGRGYFLREGKDVAIIACGVMVSEALRASKILSREGIDSAVVNMHTIKPIDEKFIVELAKDLGKIVICEEHTVLGGLYSAVSEVLISQYPIKIARIGIEDKFGQSGQPDELMNAYGLSASHIADKVKNYLREC